MQQELIQENMTIGEVVEKYPKAAEIMTRYGLHCVGCHVSPLETVKQGALGHGMPKEIFRKMMKEVNEFATNGSKQEIDEELKELKERIIQDKMKEVGYKQKMVRDILSLTDTAIKKVKSLIQNEEGVNALRVQVVSGGCSGFSYDLSFVEKGQKDDIEMDAKGLKVYIAKKSIPKLQGVRIDFVDGLQGSGFKIDNPNATGGCGCGSSFS